MQDARGTYPAHWRAWYHSRSQSELSSKTIQNSLSPKHKGMYQVCFWENRAGGAGVSFLMLLLDEMLHLEMVGRERCASRFEEESKKLKVSK